MRWNKPRSTSGSFGRGAITEERCMEDFSIHFHGELIKSTKQQDVEEHWDFSCNGVKYDVKGIKFRDDHGNSTYHYVEILNVNGHTGALFGKADFLVFEDKSSWIVLKKAELIKLLIVMTRKESKTKEPWTLYSREDRQDLMVKVPTMHLINHAFMIVPKTGDSTSHQQ